MKKILAILLALSMVLCMMPTMAFAGQDTESKEALSDASVTFSQTSFEYAGAAVAPEVTVTLNGKIVPKDEYRIAYLKDGSIEALSEAKSPGTYKVKVEAEADSANYEGSVTSTATFKIEKKPIAKVTLTNPSTFVAGTQIKDISLTMKNGFELLEKEKDYTIESLSGETAVVSGAQQILVKAKDGGNYSGQFPLTIYGGIDLTSDYEVEVLGSYVYDGTAKQPSVKVYKKTDAAKRDIGITNYTVSYENNINATTNAKVTVTGKNEYANTLTTTFEIEPRDINKATVSAIPNQTQNHTAKPDVKDGTKELKEGIDYVLSYDSNVSANGDARLMINGMNNYKGSITCTYKIKKAITGYNVVYTKTNYDYTGYAITPEIKVESGDPKKPYRLGYEYQILGGGKTDAGTYTFTLVGIGEYGGEFYRGTYTISPASLTKSGIVSLPADSFSYADKAVEPSVTVTCGGRVLRKDVDYTLTYLNNNKIGTASVIIYGKGNYTGYITKQFQITGKSIASTTATLSQTTYNYDGLEKKPAVTVYDGTKKLTNGIDYTVAYKNNKNPGTASVIITGKGKYGGTKTLTFRIIGNEQTVTTKYTRYSKTLASKPFNLYADHDGDGYLVYRSSDPSVATVSATGTVTVKGTGRAIITVSTAGTVKYDPAYKEVTVTVKPEVPKMTLSSTTKNVIKVTFTKVEGATKYQVRYGRMGRYFYKEVTHKDNEYPKTYTTLKNRTSGKPYYIKVRAYKTLADGTRVYGDWTEVKSIRSK